MKLSHPICCGVALALLVACSSQVEQPHPSPTSATTPSPVPELAPELPATPAPSTAGPLNEQVMPRSLLGFSPVPAQPAEGEYVANGTFVVAMDATRAPHEALPGCLLSDQVPPARHALEASYANDRGESGYSLALQFASSEDATRWFGLFSRDVAACSDETTPTSTPTTLYGVRDVAESVFTEACVLNGDLVRLAALEGHHDGSALLRALASFPR